MVAVVIAFVAGILAGVGMWLWRDRTEKRKRRRIPAQWPLRVRLLLNSNERIVWLWLCKVMFDQQVLIKLPVTRFTSPADMDQASQWYQLLNGVYCTFTVCGHDARAIGCVDVLSAGGPSESNQNLKHSLLTQCGLQYWVIDPAKLPLLTEIRTSFLGERALRNNQREVLDARFQDTRNNLHAAVERQRMSMNRARKVRRDADLLNQTDDGPATVINPDSIPASAWEHNSFLTPLDSRAGDL